MNIIEGEQPKVEPRLVTRTVSLPVNGLVSIEALPSDMLDVRAEGGEVSVTITPAEQAPQWSTGLLGPTTGGV